MLEAVEASLPADIAVFTAAVADWRVATAGDQKLKKTTGGPPRLELVENPDILRTIAKLPRASRPRLVIGFAAETEKVVAHATAKRKKKGCDWIVANDVSPESGVMGGRENTVHLIKGDDHVDDWPRMSKDEVAERLVREAAAAIGAARA
jgi:phosphopantothenoylcysteine decarboxylase/phosphopantothenate--cysteine ligase